MSVFRFFGGNQPVRIVGSHAVRLAMFAEQYRGWHTIGKDRTTRRAVQSCAKRGAVEIVGDQFRWIA